MEENIPQKISHKFLSLRIKKDNKEDNIRKKGNIKVIYPKFEAVGSFVRRKIKFSNDNVTSRFAIDFVNLKDIPKDKIILGDDMMAHDGSMIIRRFYLNSKGEAVLVRLETLIFNKPKRAKTSSRKIKRL